MNQKPINKYLLSKATWKITNIVNSAIKLCELLPEDMFRSCLNCDNFKEDVELCTKFNARPPARVIAFGCDDYFNINEEIPF